MTEAKAKGRPATWVTGHQSLQFLWPLVRGKRRITDIKPQSWCDTNSLKPE